MSRCAAGAAEESPGGAGAGAGAGLGGAAVGKTAAIVSVIILIIAIIAIISTIVLIMSVIVFLSLVQLALPVSLACAATGISWPLFVWPACYIACSLWLKASANRIYNILQTNKNEKQGEPQPKHPGMASKHKKHCVAE